MLKADLFPVCTTNKCGFFHWFVLQNVIVNHPLLNEDEKSIWRWLTCYSAHSGDSTCTFSYEELSQALGMPCKRIHSALLRFRVMGFLQTKIPVWYGKLTPEMESEMRTLIPAVPSTISLKIPDHEFVGDFSR